ncbi:phosphoadenylyl-sulfate reductase [Alkalicoccus daliensis]|uniref:Adenosine 5'-phosphosulfate reductase n=1 Tax=Alkalicoccus daliensis TaxID=745820 RepID=A0A1H0KQU9_9BACI|nr:phosphoadenylyl-sulfate reductase [Alkalicoccus daliensis]SDO58166.1 phosphoadenosine phosphosulfate reductase [Alkalicoccus daliensis]
MAAEKVTYENFSGDPFSDWTPDDKNKGADTILQWAYDAYGSDLVYACSFGAEGIVLIDMIAKIKEDAHIVFLDTGVHFKETYELIEKVKKRYPSLKIEMKQPELTIAAQASQYGEELWKTDPNQCCYIRKILPLEEALTGVPAWISGLRREQSESRKNTNFVNKDERFHSVKVCPLIYWTWDDVWNYIQEHHLDYNELHDRGYPSIGCAPCTTAVETGDSRGGRWQGTMKTECGLHLPGSAKK